jgi:hypothetical protein
MVEPTDIEKKSLEAHVELCAERYNALETRLDHVDNKISRLEAIIREVHDMVQRMAEKNNDRLITWGVGIIGALSATTIYLVTHYIFK